MSKVFLCFLLVGAVAGRWVKMDSDTLPYQEEKGCAWFSEGKLVTKCIRFKSHSGRKFEHLDRPRNASFNFNNDANSVTFRNDYLKAGNYLVVHSNGVVETNSNSYPVVTKNPFNTDGNVLIYIFGGCQWEVTEGFPVAEVADTPPPPDPTPAPTPAPTNSPKPLTCEKPQYSGRTVASTPNPRRGRGLAKVNRLLGDLSKWPKLVSPKLQAERGLLRKKNTGCGSAMSLALTLMSFLIHAMP